MSYADRLRAEIAQKGAPPPTAKTDKTGSVSFVSTSRGTFPSTDLLAQLAERALVREDCAAAGIDPASVMADLMSLPVDELQHLGRVADEMRAYRRTMGGA